MNQQELKNILDLHRKWVMGKEGGSRADLRSADLRFADLRPDSNRPAERWFLGIGRGDIPQSNPVSDVTAEWMREWMSENGIAFPVYEMVARWPDSAPVQPEGAANPAVSQ